MQNIPANKIRPPGLLFCLHYTLITCRISSRPVLEHIISWYNNAYCVFLHQIYKLINYLISKTWVIDHFHISFSIFVHESPVTNCRDKARWTKWATLLAQMPRSARFTVTCFQVIWLIAIVGREHRLTKGVVLSCRWYLCQNLVLRP